VILSILILGSGALYWRATRSTDVRVATHTTEHEPKTAEVTATGMIDAVSATPVEARVSGVVQGLYCDVGSKVNVGQTCARIDPRPFQIIVDRSKADAALSNERLEKSKARAARALAALGHARLRVGRGAIGPKGFEKLQSVARQAQAEMARDEVSARSNELVLRATTNTLKLTEIVSPIDGVVISRLVEIGRWVTAENLAPLFLVARDLTIVKITIKLDEKEFRAIRIGDKVSFSVEQLPGSSFEGVASVISLSQPDTIEVGTVDLVITARNPDLQLKPGMSAKIKINAGRGD
jgi:RND family efflux transporter MFP subunit